MKQLSIILTEKINSSNFDEWKTDLISQIQATNIELITDNDFIEATKSENELDLEIDKRIARYREELARVELEKHKLIKLC